MATREDFKQLHFRTHSREIDQEKKLKIDDLAGLFYNEYDKNKRKIFHRRESYLTIMFRQTHFMALYNLALALWIASILNFTYKYFVNYENIKRLTHNLWNIFTSFHTIFILAVVYNMLAISLYFPLKLFSRFSVSRFKFIFFFIWMCTLFIFLALFFHISILFMKLTDGFPVGRMVAVLEQVRLLMKMYAFMHDTVPGIVKRQLKVKGSEKFVFPKIRSYIYYLFSPTLVYRDEYPRTDNINWEAFFLNASGCICAVMAWMYVIHFSFIEKFLHVGKNPMTIMKLISLVLESVLPATLVLFFVFFGFLHAFLNATSELMMFADRMFYTDWWNSTSYSEYYKKWNVLVHDWIRSYLFEDIKKIFGGRKGVIISSITVITISSLVHEYITYMIIQSLVPGFMVLFGFFGLILKFINPQFIGARTRRYINISFLWTYVFGCSVLLTLYFGEYFSAINCPLPQKSSFYMYLIPRLITADCVTT